MNSERFLDFRLIYRQIKLDSKLQGFKFVTTLISTLLSPISILLKGNAGGSGKAKHGKEPWVPVAKFSNLIKLMSPTLSNHPENPSPSVLLRSPYLEEMGELGNAACKENPTLKSQRSTQVLRDFCFDHAGSFKLLDSLDSFAAGIDTKGLE